MARQTLLQMLTLHLSLALSKGKELEKIDFLFIVILWFPDEFLLVGFLIVHLI
jgi:hypothetical protein